MTNNNRPAPGTLLKRRPFAASTLSGTPQSRRLTGHLLDLITIACEHFTNTRWDCLELTRLEYVSGENNDGKCSMHFVALARELPGNGSAPLKVTFIVEPKEDNECYPH